MSFQICKTFVHLRNTNDPLIDRKGTTTVKAQKGSKNIIKIVNVTSVVQPLFLWSS